MLGMITLMAIMMMVRKLSNQVVPNLATWNKPAPLIFRLLFGIAYDLKKSNPTNISSNSEMTMLSKFRTMSFQLAALPRARQTWSSSGTGRTFKKLEEKMFQQ